MGCPKCGSEFMKKSSAAMTETVTLVGFAPPTRDPVTGKTCDHDDNCRVRTYSCTQNHVTLLSIINSCHCGWKGADKCFCSVKVAEWPKF